MHFAAFLGVIDTQTAFMAIDGVHRATIKDDNVALRMTDVSRLEIHKEFSFLNTGSPHHVEMVTNLKDIDVVDKGRAIRNNRYGAAGANINFVSKISEDTFSVRTYERGVEDETLSREGFIFYTPLIGSYTEGVFRNFRNKIYIGPSSAVAVIPYSTSFINNVYIL